MRKVEKLYSQNCRDLSDTDRYKNILLFNPGFLKRNVSSVRRTSTTMQRLLGSAGVAAVVDPMQRIPWNQLAPVKNWFLKVPLRVPSRSFL